MSSDSDLRKRLEALNRKPLPPRATRRGDVDDVRRKLTRRRKTSQDPPPAADEAPKAILYRRDLPLPERKPRSRPTTPARPVDLAAAVKGEEVAGPRGGRAFLITSDIREIEEAPALCNTFRDCLLRDGSNLRRWLGVMCGTDRAAPEDVIFVDLETTGLGSTPLFLIGTMTWEAGGLVVRQYFARNYAEEPAVISLFLACTARKNLLVSFNGKSFDLPYVRVRSAANRIPFEIALDHLDLLHVSRRVWRGRLPDCRLQTLERHVCGRMRYGDIPGQEIPQAYHDFVRTGDARLMVECLKHNMLDLVTLADLMTRLPPPG